MVAPLQALSHEVSALVSYTAYGSPGIVTEYLAGPAHAGDEAVWGSICATLGATQAQRERLRVLVADLERQTQQLSTAELHLQNAIKVGPMVLQ